MNGQRYRMHSSDEYCSVWHGLEKIQEQKDFGIAEVASDILMQPQ